MEELKDYTVRKGTSEYYQVRHKTGMYWANISIVCYEKAGEIQIRSDFGDWSFYWGSCGSSFKEFLQRLDIGYVARKFGEDSYFDFDKTISWYKQDLIEFRREESISAEKAREIYDQIKEAEDEGFTERNAFQTRIYSSMESLSSYLMDGDMGVIEIISPRFNNFWDGPWKKFMEQLKEETKIEAS